MQLEDARNRNQFHGAQSSGGTERHTYVDLHFSVQAIVDDQVVRHTNSEEKKNFLLD